MKFTYCPDCGSELMEREIGDEGLIPFCETCSRPWFPLSYTCTITLVVNELGEIGLIRQGYVSATNFICVAGYMKLRERAEDTAAREVLEEVGLKAEKIIYIDSYPFERRDMLMLGFVALVKKDKFCLSGEVDQAEWFSYEMAMTNLKEGSIARRLCEAGYAKVRGLL